MNKNRLSFARGNAKLNPNTAILSLPAGWTCPFAKDCKSCTNRQTGKITDGKDCRFRCYAVTPETLFPAVRRSRWHNFELLKNARTVIGMANLLESSLIFRKNLKMVRFGGSGDFFNQNYFDATVLTAQQHPEWILYGYTKALPYWAKRLNTLPPNLRLTASRGGTHDYLIKPLGLRSAQVVFTEQEAKDMGLEIDHDDTHCWKGTTDFAILLHGTQPAGSAAGKAWYKISKHGKGGYKSDYFGHMKKAQAKRDLLARVGSVPVISIPGKRSGKLTIHGIKSVFATTRLGGRMTRYTYA